jgi:putative chitinase
MPITQQQLLQILPNAGPQAGIFVPVLNTAMGAYQIITTQRIAAFLAQVGHESTQFTHLMEGMNYAAAALTTIFSRDRISLADANTYGRTATQPANQQAIANCIYGGAWGLANLGNTQPGDGWAFRGRGLIQITGRANYQKCGDALGVDLIGNPDQLAQPQYAALSAGWFWQVNGLNSLADAGEIQDVGSIINTGKRGKVPNGAADRLTLYNTALQVLA